MKINDKLESFYEHLKPKQIVIELNRYIVGQNDAKRAVAIAVRNRWRRSKIEAPLGDEIIPNNILMVGPTGVGKTEISRRLAKLVSAPLVKVEASKFTEVGYVGRDVESMIRDLVQVAVDIIRDEMSTKIDKIAARNVRQRILDSLIPKSENHPESESYIRTREKIGSQLDSGNLDEKEIEISVLAKSMQTLEIVSQSGFEEYGVNFQEMLSEIFGKKKKQQKLTIKQARKILLQEEIDRLLNKDRIIEIAKTRTQESGIVFIDEIDKIVGSNSSSGPDVSREGVQRDLLPLVEGTSVTTKYGIIRTDHILFIAAGAFSNSSPSDLIPEFQGRFPIRAELSSLSAEDFKRILVEPENSLIKQYKALLAAEGIKLEFTDAAIREISEIAYEINQKTEDIGARRLHTALSLLLEDILFEAPDISPKNIKITKSTVVKKLSSIVEDEDLMKFIL